MKRVEHDIFKPNVSLNERNAAHIFKTVVVDPGF